MRYPVMFDCDETGCAVLFPDIPEAMTGGDTREEALAMAQDALVTAFEFYFEDRREIPAPSSEGEAFVEVPASVAAKILLLNEVVRQGISNADLARMIDTRPQEITRIFNLQHATKIDTIQKALSALGRRLEMTAA
ncbi:type II toxin-antitoxin system HicB family antitoxin [Pantoea dispersa]|uniref:type II toxin-antitoxin system HicB family antitoxin n=1 Tax=Pantoea dispersa TaxID=59814 RepID=UPI0028DE778A|nr:type II toxin-antitoxin system HicB family antitoxin [Pantoea dispersa]MDT8853000.1 type II toxin-antitoxin system HicB family antitoxin [Pantoea dispersa]